MTNLRLKKQLQQFKAVQPSPTWLAARRAVLMSQIEAQVAEREIDTFKHRARMLVWSIEAMFTGVINGIAGRGLAVAGLLVALSLGGSGYVLAAADSSIPGDTLYPVKLAVEDMRLKTARTQKARVALEVEFASRRLYEVQQLATRPDQGVEHATVLVAQFQENLSKVSATTALSNNSANSSEVALLLDEKLTDYRHALTNTTASDPELQKELRKAISTVSRAQTQTLKVIVENDEQPTDVVVEKISDKIRVAEESLRMADEKLASESTISGAGTKANANVREQSAIAKVNLAEARQKISEGDYRAAVGIIDQIEDIVYEVEEVVAEQATGEVKGATDSNDSTENTSTIVE